MAGRRRHPERTNAVLQRIHSLKDRLRSSQVVTDELERLRAENEELRRDREELRQALEESQESVEESLERLRKKEKARAEAELTSQALLRRVRETEKEVHESLSRLREMEDATALADRLESELEEAESEKARLACILERLQGELNEVRGENAVLVQDLEVARQEASEARIPADSNGGESRIESDVALELAHLREERVKASKILKRLVDAVGTARSERDAAVKELEEVRSAHALTPPMPGVEEDPSPDESDDSTRSIPRPPAHSELGIEEEKLRALLEGLQAGIEEKPTEARKGSKAKRSGVSAQTEAIGPQAAQSAPATSRAAGKEEVRHPLAYLFDAEEPPERLGLDTVRQLTRSYLSFLKRSPGEALRFSYGGNLEEYLRQHSHNVAKLAMFLGMHLGDPDEDLLLLGLSGLLHDVGLAEVPESILRKPGPLNDTEVRWIQMHPAIGARILEQVEGLEKDVPLIIRQHHERVDGSGYPDGLKGDRIHRFARILNLVDGYEAMSAPRVYREELLPNESMRVITRPLIIAQALDLPGGISEGDITNPSPSRAMEQVVLQTPQVHDAELVRAFLIAMSYYPIGSYVQVSSGEVARVVGTNGEEVKRPIVKVVLGSDGRVPRDQILIDLGTDRTREISHAVSGLPYEDLP